jgi:N-6 DNA Methylase
MVAPRHGQSILDPACGSGGFLIHALVYLKERYEASEPEEVRALAQSIRGVDIFDTATKLCQINLFLHGDCHDNVVRGDSLDPDETPEFMRQALSDPEQVWIVSLPIRPLALRKAPAWNRRGSKMSAKNGGRSVSTFSSAV